MLWGWRWPLFAASIAAVLAVCIAGELSGSHHPRQNAPESNRQPGQGEQQPDAVSNVPPSFVPLKVFTLAGRKEIAAYCAAQPKKEEQKWAKDYICDIKITDAYLAAFNFLLVIVTGGLIFIGWKTIGKMRDTEERQLRAYVFASPGQLARPVGRIPNAPPVTRWSFDITFKNSGQTPAYDFHQFTVSEVFAVPTPEGNFDIAPEGPISNAVLPAGESVTTRGHCDVTGADLAAIQAGQRALYVFGEIRYADAFKRRWLTRFRFMHGRDQGLTDLIFCEAGNGETEE